MTFESGRVVVGVGARSVVPAAEVVAAGLAGLEHAGLPDTLALAGVATLDRRADVVRPLADRLGLPLILFTDAELAEMTTPHTVRLTGAPSVAEAAALRAAGPGAQLLLPKIACGSVTVAIAR